MSAADAPSRKRSRPAESADPDTSRDIKNSEDFWFQDGSVVLQAERERFRVHRTILERHSSVFRDMFSFPQPQPLPDDADVVDGCPLIHLSDSASDVAVVLGILYDGSKKILNPKAKRVLSISRVAAMARLGRKYDIPFMQDAALSYLELDFPATLAEWDAHHHRPEHILGVGCKSYVLNLSYELGWTKLMPAAFLHHLAHTLLYYGRDHIIFNTTPVPLAPAHFHQQIFLPEKG